MKYISVLGSTGSIGTQTLEVVRNNGDIQVTALAAGRNIRLLEKQIREFHPALACVWDEDKAKELRIKTADLPVRIVWGMEGLLEAAVEARAQIVVTAVVGMIGIRPTIAAMEAGKDIALPGILSCPWPERRESGYCRWTASTALFSSALTVRTGGPFTGSC